MINYLEICLLLRNYCQLIDRTPQRGILAYNYSFDILKIGFLF